MRDYGLGNYTQYVVGRPHLAATTDLECPNCSFAHMGEIRVVLQGMPVMPTEFAIGTYLSCPACPFASPMVCFGVSVKPDWFKEKKQ